MEGRAYSTAGPLVRENLRRNRRRMIEVINRITFKWALRLQRLGRLPGVVSEVYLYGQNCLERTWEKAPILVFSHKKIHDAVVFLHFMLARPMVSFLPHTVIAQGGLFSAIYLFRDFVPAGWKRSFLRRPAIAVSRAVGRWMDMRLRSFNCHPVHRRFRDVPSQRIYESPYFAGGELMGRDYESYLEFTRDETKESLHNVMSDIQEKNMCLVLFPEGKYQHNGEVAKANRTIEEMAKLTKHPVLCNSLSYDELCPDRLGRIDAFIQTVQEEKAPQVPGESFRDRIQRILQEGTVATASHLLALSLSRLRTRPFRKTELVEIFENICRKAIETGSLIDERLRSADFRIDRIRRFFRGPAAKWLVLKKGVYEVSAKRLVRYRSSERTVNDLDWNINNISHLVPYL